MSERDSADVEAAEARAYELLLGATSPETRTRHGIAACAVDGALALVSSGMTRSMMFNRTIGLMPGMRIDQAWLDSLTELYAARGVESFALEIPSCLDVDPSGLKASRFMPFKRTITMLLTNSKIVGAAHACPVPKGTVEVRRVGRPEASLFARLCCAVFSLDSEPFEDFLESSFAEDRVRHWMAFAGARPVATAMTVHVGDRFAWIGWVATIPEFRGMGIQSALARRQIEACAEEGIERVSLEAAAPTRHGGGTSLRNYQRLGWRSVHQRIVYLRRAS